MRLFSVKAKGKTYTTADLFAVLLERKGKLRLIELLIVAVVALGTFMVIHSYGKIKKLEGQLIYEKARLANEKEKLERDIAKLRKTRSLPIPTINQLLLSIKRLENQYDLIPIKRVSRTARFTIEGMSLRGVLLDTSYKYSDGTKLKQFLKKLDAGWREVVYLKTSGDNAEVRIVAAVR